MTTTKNLITWEGTPERLGQLLAAEAEVERLRTAIGDALGLLADGVPFEAADVLGRALDGEVVTYKIRRFYEEADRPSKTIATGLTLAEAQAHCQHPETHGEGWFDGYDEEA